MTTIKVTQNKIDCGQRANIYACPVNLAVTETLGPGFLTDGTHIHHRGRERDDVCMALPPGVSAKIANYDNGYGMEPFEFEIEDFPE